jgi:hypothetical protein
VPQVNQPVSTGGIFGNCFGYLFLQKISGLLMTLFTILWVFDGLALLVVLYFFLIGIADRSVSGRNIGLWITLIFLLMLILGGSICIRNQYPLWSLGLLWLLAIPALLYLIFIIVAILGTHRKN